METNSIFRLNWDRISASQPEPTANALTAESKLLDQVRQAIRTRHYSDRTEKAYVHWIKRYI